MADEPPGIHTWEILIMKNMLSGALLALAGLAGLASSTQAGTFGLFTCGGACCNKCGIVIRPYNAFSPLCAGSICGLGCGHGCGKSGGCASGNCGEGESGGCSSGGCSSCAANQQFVPGTNAMAYARPMTAPPAPPVAPYTYQQPMMSYYPIQPTNYYAPAYNPYYNYGYAPAMPTLAIQPVSYVPYYWGTGR